MSSPSGEDAALRPWHDAALSRGSLEATMPESGAKALAHLRARFPSQMSPGSGPVAMPKALPRAFGRLRTSLHGHLRPVPSRPTAPGLCPGLQTHFDLWPRMPCQMCESLPALSTGLRDRLFPQQMLHARQEREKAGTPMRRALCALCGTVCQPVCPSAVHQTLLRAV